MSAVHIADVEQKEIVPGFRARLIHGDSMTIAYWEIDGGNSLPEHSHPHEQLVNMVEGEFELTVDGTPNHLRPGDVYVIPGDVPHSGRSITDCRIIDVWHPCRDDYR